MARSFTELRMSATELQRAFAQIVLTFTEFVTPNEGTIGRVRFVSDGAGLSVFVPLLGGTSDPGAELARDDFIQLVVGTSVSPADPNATTTTTTTTTVTTEPIVTEPTPSTSGA